MSKVRVNVSDERIKDLICNSLDGGYGGSHYWAEIKAYNYPDGKTKESYRFPFMELPLTQTGSIVIHDLEGNKDYTLDRKACLKGLSIMAKDQPKFFADFMSEDDDAETGDIFLQCALFGEVIYG
jgi:hypothetical protein